MIRIVWIGACCCSSLILAACGSGADNTSADAASDLASNGAIQFNDVQSALCSQDQQEPCHVAGAAGVCAEGTRICGADGTWGACAGPTAESEVCDNDLDDDCDGRPDTEDPDCTDDCLGPDDSVIANGQSKDYYQASAHSDCASVVERRTCGAGELSGSFTYPACVDQAASCETGATETRTRYESASVPHGQACSSETQRRSCEESEWSPWSGTFSAPTCTPAAAAPCGASPSGSSASRTMYQSATVPHGQTCQAEQQSRTCDNGQWSAWTGSFAAPACSVEAAPACIDNGISAQLAALGGQNCHGGTFPQISIQSGSESWSGCCSYVVRECKVSGASPLNAMYCDAGANVWCNEIPHGQTHVVCR